MCAAPSGTAHFNIVAVVQQGRLAHEALLLAASLRLSDPGFAGDLILCEPLPGPLWPGGDPRLPEGPHRARLADLGALFVPFESRVFGASYPHGNKIEALAALPDAPFLFLDTDTLVTGALSRVAFDFSRPSASMRREGTWPEPPPYGPGHSGIWKALYDRFGLDFASSLDLAQPDEYWQRYLYFNGGWFFHESPVRFGSRFLDYARTIRDDTPPELACQELYPWLDQIALPLVVHGLGGGRPGPELAGLDDGSVTCHYRTLPLLYARESDAAISLVEQIAREQANRRILRDWPQLKRMVLRNEGRKARALFDRANLPRHEKDLRRILRDKGLWMR